MAPGPVEIIAPVSPDWDDPWRNPALYRAVTLRRVLAYGADALVVTVAIMAVWSGLGVLTLLSFGLLWPLQALGTALVPLAYHTLLVAGPRSATLGMRLFGLRVRSLAPDNAGQGPSLFQALVLTIAFYGSVALSASLVLVVALFNPRRRTLHDWLAGTVMVRC